MNSIFVLVLAAGLGRRFGSLKQLAAFGPGKHTILEYSLFDAHRLGFRRAVCVIQEIHKKFFNELLAPLMELMEIEFAYQRLDDVPAGISNFHRTKPWGTAHAVYSARSHLRAPFITINADDFYGQRAWEQMANFIQKTPSKNALLAFRLDRTLSSSGPVARGICSVDENHLMRIEEFSNITRSNGSIRAQNPERQFVGNEPTSLNFWYLQPKILQKMDFKHFFTNNQDLTEAEWMLPIVIQNLLDERKIDVTVVNTQSHWTGITYPSDTKRVIHHIEDAIRSGAYPEVLWRKRTVSHL
ncbi:MAG: hypothetical protein LBF26_01360 [Puniceicoccales bacterium]|jgi:NDP-sugar pyrophosphorylase family protein|nr:hypothetical protein [Puniceicoccales bacterium]